MDVYRLYTYDVWGNEEDGWEVNDTFRRSTQVFLDPTLSDTKIIKHLIRKGVVNKNTDFSKINILGEEDVLYFEYDGKPEFELRKEEIEENPKPNWWVVQNKYGDTRVVRREERPIGKIVMGPFNTRKVAERLAWSRLELKDNPVEGTKIYDKIQAIEAQKGKDSLWPKENFRHDFKEGGEIIGLPNGDLLVKKNKKRLWKHFNYD